MIAEIYQLIRMVKLLQKLITDSYLIFSFIRPAFIDLDVGSNFVVNLCDNIVMNR